MKPSENPGYAAALLAATMLASQTSHAQQSPALEQMQATAIQTGDILQRAKTYKNISPAEVEMLNNEGISPGDIDMIMARWARRDDLTASDIRAIAKEWEQSKKETMGNNPQVIAAWIDIQMRTWVRKYLVRAGTR